MNSLRFSGKIKIVISTDVSFHQVSVDSGPITWSVPQEDLSIRRSIVVIIQIATRIDPLSNYFCVHILALTMYQGEPGKHAYAKQYQQIDLHVLVLASHRY